MAIKTTAKATSNIPAIACKVGVGLVVLGVAASAAYGSYDHQVALAMDNGWHGLAADLFPVMPDGMMVVGGVSLLLPKTTRNTRAWGRVMTFTGLALTMYANVITGVGFGVDGMILASFPAVALFISTEALFRIIRDLSRKTGQRPALGIVARFLAWNRKRRAAAKRRAQVAAKRAAQSAPRHAQGDLITA
jgi:hypothetical protein